jgi:hypothetical protein
MSERLAYAPMALGYGILIDAWEKSLQVCVCVASMQLHGVSKRGPMDNRHIRVQSNLGSRT